MKKRLQLFLAAIVTSVACGDATSPTPASLVGTWALTSVNGLPLPYQATIKGYDNSGAPVTGQLNFLAGTLVLRGNGTWTQQVTLHSILGSQDTTGVSADSGTYRIQQDSISFDRNDPQVSDFDHWVGAVSGDKILMPAFLAYLLVYRKQ